MHRIVWNKLFCFIISSFVFLFPFLNFCRNMFYIFLKSSPTTGFFYIYLGAQLNLKKFFPFLTYLNEFWILFNYALYFWLFCFKITKITPYILWIMYEKISFSSVFQNVTISSVNDVSFRIMYMAKLFKNLLQPNSVVSVMKSSVLPSALAWTILKTKIINLWIYYWADDKTRIYCTYYINSTGTYQNLAVIIFYYICCLQMI